MRVGPLFLSLFKRRRGEASPELAEVERLIARAQRATAPLERDELFRHAAHATVRAMSPAIRRFCRDQLGGDEGLGDEAAQQTWLTFWRVLPRFEGRSQLSTFLFGVARNVCSDLRRLRRHERADLPESERSEWPDHDDRLEQARRREALAAAVQTLDPASRWLLMQRLVEERNYREILPIYQALFGGAITTEEGLRSAFFKAKRALITALGGSDD